jgi:fatty-acyl-CoA synthase
MDINWIVDSPFEALPVGDKNATALCIDGKESLTYAGLRERRDRYIRVLQEHGVGHGDRVGILLLNSLDYVALYFAIGRIGAIAVRLNFRLSATELTYIIGDAGCHAVFFHSSRTPQLEPLHDSVVTEHWLCVADDETPVPTWASTPDLDSPPADATDIPRPRGTDPLMLMYTSGTTGRPKGSVWTHENSLWAATSQSMVFKCSADTVAMTAGPLYHVGAFEVLVLPAMLMHGKAVILSSQGMTNERIVTAMRTASVTHALLYPFMLYDLVRSDDVRSEDLASLRLVLCGGDPAQPWALQAMRERFPAVEVQQAYGLTEGGSIISYLDHEAGLTHPDSAGRPLPLIDIRTMRPDGQPTEVDEVGEVWVRSGAISGTFWNKPEETAATFVDGWCRTGDLGRVTPDGYLVLTGRSKDMIRSGGENVYPAEIEAVLGAHSGVGAIAVIAVPDALRLEVGCAVVRPADPGASHADLERELRELAALHLAGYKRPRYYEFVDSLPATASGKIQKMVLREQFANLAHAAPPVATAHEGA